MAELEPEALTIDVPGLRIAALAWGPASAPPVLALHGWLDNAASFEPIAPHLLGVRLVALDLPGHGHSDHRPPSAHYDFLEYVVDVAAVADALGWTRFSLLGHSMGAAVASLAAGTLVGRVTGLALVEGLGPNAVPSDEAPARLAKSIAERGRREARPPREHGDRASAEERLRAAAALSADAARRLVARGTRDIQGGVTWRSDARLRGTSPFRITEEHVRAFLARIACPSVLIRARAGHGYDPALVAGRVAITPGLRMVEVDGGHHVHMDRPAEVAAIVATVLGGTTSARWPGDATEVSASAAPTPTSTPSASPPREPRASALRARIAPDVLRRAAAIALVILDVDGVLTDGELDYGPDGDQLKRFFVRDGLGIKLLQQAGVKVGILSGRASAATLARAKDLGLDPVLTGVSDKVAALDRVLADGQLDVAKVAYMGDDVVDVAVMRKVGLAAAPADAHEEARRVSHLVSACPGGRGAVRELAEAILEAQGRWVKLLEETTWPAHTKPS